MLTIGQVARSLQTSKTRVAYILDRWEIQPDARAGRVRLFNAQTVAQIATLNDKLEARRLLMSASGSAGSLHPA